MYSTLCQTCDCRWKLSWLPSVSVLGGLMISEELCQMYDCRLKLSWLLSVSVLEGRQRWHVQQLLSRRLSFRRWRWSGRHG